MKIRKLLIYIFACALLFGTFSSLPVHAATVEQLTTEMETIEAIINDEGQDLSTINVEEILVTLDGVPIVATEFVPTEQGINYVFLLDISGSVPDKHMNAAKEQILSLYKTLREQDQLSVITFGDEVHTIIEGTETADEVQAILETVRCDDAYTHFYDAINLILERIDTDADIQNVAIIVSDGINTGDVSISIDELYASLNESNITLHALAVDAAKASDIDNFREFVQLSGGQLYAFNPSNCADSMSNLTGAFERTYRLKSLADSSLITGENQSLLIQIGEHIILEQEIKLEKPDITAPTIISWEVIFEKQTLALFFSEPMADLKTPEQYQITAPDGSLAPVTVIESNDDSVTLQIQGLNNAPGWRADFDGLRDASSNGNALEYESILITPEIVEDPEEPTTEAPIDEESTESDFLFYIKEYWYFIVVGVLLLFALILLILLKVSRKKKDDSLVEFTEDNDAVAESNDTTDSSTAPMIAAAPSRQAISGSEGPRLQRTLSGTKITSDKKKATQDDDYDTDDDGVHMSKGMTRIGATPQTGATVSRRKRRNIDDEDDIGVHMSKGMVHMGAVPTKDSSGNSDSGNDSDDRGEVHVNEHKRERKGFLGLFRSRKGKSAEILEDEDLGVAVNEPLRGVHAPTRKVESEKVADEYEVDLVSNHRRTRTIKQVRRGWFTWKEKDIPEAPDAETTENTTFSSEGNASNEDEYTLDKKTVRKYIKPRRTLLKRKMKPMIEQDFPKQEGETDENIPIEATETEAEYTVAVTPIAMSVEVHVTAPDIVTIDQNIKSQIAEDSSPINDVSQLTPDQSDAIKSGGFDLSGISIDYRPGLFSSSLGDRKSKKKRALLVEEAEQDAKKHEKTASVKNAGSNSSVRAGKSSSTQKNITFTFDDGKKK